MVYSITPVLRRLLLSRGRTEAECWDRCLGPHHKEYGLQTELIVQQLNQISQQTESKLFSLKSLKELMCMKKIIIKINRTGGTIQIHISLHAFC